MDSYEVDNIKHLANTEVVRRLLIKYFLDKGFKESFDRQLYPAMLQDITKVIPILVTKIEVVPSAKEIDPYQGKATLQWNLFVLGTHRMYLGDTYHNSLHDLARQIRSGNISMAGHAGTARRQTTPRRVVAFITRVLGDHESGYVDLAPSTKALQAIGEPTIARHNLMSIPNTQTFGRIS